MSLLGWLQEQIASGRNIGWQSFGQGTGWNSQERGQDIGEPLGTPIPGTVGTVQSVTSWGYGDSAVTILDRLGNLLTIGHVTPAVTPGQAITDQSVIGYSRGLKSPISSGPHIEFQVQPKGSATVVDPLTWLHGIAAQTPGVDVATAQTSPGASVPVLGGITAGAQGIGASLAGMAQSFASIASVFTGVWNFIAHPGNWWRLAFYLVGGLMVVVGVYVYVHEG